jgi:hypothetical protein
MARAKRPGAAVPPAPVSSTRKRYIGGRETQEFGSSRGYRGKIKRSWRQWGAFFYYMLKTGDWGGLVSVIDVVSMESV